MKRTTAYWIWLLADVSLERAASILPLIGFPDVEHAAVRRSIDLTGVGLKPDATDLKALGKIISAGLRSELGDFGKLVETWLQSFPFTDQTSRPDLLYWESHFQNLLGDEPAVKPETMDTQRWKALLAAYQGIKSNSSEPWAGAFAEAAEVILKQRMIRTALKKARAIPLSTHDLEIYMRFGWNDYGVNQGLSSLEIGARLSTAKFFWQAVAQYVPAEILESLAYKHDLASWEIAANPSQFLKDAQRYGVTPEQMAVDIFPKPKSPPKLNCLLEG
jgi:hypothetical protein